MAFSLYVIAPDSFTYILSLSLSRSLTSHLVCVTCAYTLCTTRKSYCLRKCAANSAHPLWHRRTNAPGCGFYVRVHRGTHTWVCKLGMHRLRALLHSTAVSLTGDLCRSLYVVHALCPAAAVCVRVTVRTCHTDGHTIHPTYSL